MKFGRARIQADGSIMYPKRGWEPPPPIEGYARDPQNMWRFVPKWPECEFRFRKSAFRDCGAIYFITGCQCKEAEMYSKEVKLADCADCPFAKRKSLPG